MQRSFLSALVVAALLYAGPQSVSVAGVINFDDQPYGGLTYIASDSYRSSGGVFSRDIPIYSVAAVEANWWVTIFQAGGGTLPNVMALSPAIDSRRTIDMTFVVPGTNTSATTNFVSALLGDSEVGSTIGLFEAFDINGNLIGALSPTTPSSSVSLLQFNTPGIARIRFSDVDDGFEIDNISFNTPAPIPEPSISLLLLSGLGILGARRRRKSPSND